MTAFLKELKFAWGYFVLGKRRGARVPPWVAPPPLEAQLWFGSLLVADLHRMSPHQGTWFSEEYELRISRGQGELQDRVLEYIAFSEDFDRRIADGGDHDFDEFDRFGPMQDSDSWTARLPGGCTMPMEGRMWFTDGGASWQHPESEPSPEAAANVFWAQCSAHTRGNRPPPTNRDLYLALGELCVRHKSGPLTLEQFLLATLHLAGRHEHESALTLVQFHQLLVDAFDTPAAPFNKSWRSVYDSFNCDLAGYEGWRAVVIRQVVDLREMAEAGTLENEHRYFGIDAPRGGRWYNFDPCTFLECGMAGALGGWEPGDDTGRQFVTGGCTTMDSDGVIHNTSPLEMARQVVEIPMVSWELFRDFVECGQMYE